MFCSPTQTHQHLKQTQILGLGLVSSLAQVTSLEQDRFIYMIQVQSVRDKSSSVEFVPFSST